MEVRVVGDGDDEGGEFRVPAGDIAVAVGDGVGERHGHGQAGGAGEADAFAAFEGERFQGFEGGGDQGLVGGGFGAEGETDGDNAAGGGFDAGLVEVGDRCMVTQEWAGRNGPDNRARPRFTPTYRPQPLWSGGIFAFSWC